MTTAHTAGPWSFYTSPQPNGCPIVGAKGLMVAMLAHSVNEKDQKEIALANARLIAAAPDLLEALGDLLGSLSGWASMTDGDLAAEAAEGEGKGRIILAARAAIAKATGSAQ